MTASTEASESPALSRSSRPAPGSRYSGSSRGPSTSSSPITGSAGRNTEPHQKPDRGSGGEAGDPHADREGALRRVVEHVADQGERRRRQRRPGDPEQRPGGDQHLGAGR